MTETTTILTTATLPCDEGAVVNSITNTESQLEIIFQKQNNKKITNSNISEEFSILVSILIFLILIAIPLLYVSDVATFTDYEICVKHKQYSISINKIFLLGSIMSILSIPLSKHKMYTSQPNTLTKVISLAIHCIMIILLIVLSENYHYYAHFVLIISVYGIILFFNEIFLKSNTRNNNAYSMYHKHPIMYISVANSLCLMMLSCALICCAMCEVSINTDCEENEILQDIMMRCSIFYMVISVIGLWITLNTSNRIKYFCKQNLFLYEMAQHDQIHIKKMENGKITPLMACFLIYFGMLAVVYFVMCFWALYGPKYAYGSIEDFINDINT